MKKYLTVLSIVAGIAAFVLACGSPTRGLPEGVEDSVVYPAYIYSDKAAFDEFEKSFTPPSQLEVFDSWRIFYGNRLWENRAAVITENNAIPVGDEAPARTMYDQWTLVDPDSDDSTDNSYIRYTQNTNDVSGYVSPHKSRKYGLEATFGSIDGDNDYIGLVAAFERDETEDENYILAVYRAAPYINTVTGEQNGFFKWGIILARGGLLTTPYASTYRPEDAHLYSHTGLEEGDILYSYAVDAVDLYDNTIDDWAPDYVWGASGSESFAVRVRVERDGNLFTFKSTARSDDRHAEAPSLSDLGGFVDGATISVDLDNGTVSSTLPGVAEGDVTELNRFKITDSDPGHSYGYTVISQRNTTWSDIENEIMFSDSNTQNRAFYIDPETKQAVVYRFEAGVWVEDTEATIQQYFKLPAIVKNPDADESYIINKDGSIEIYILPE